MCTHKCIHACIYTCKDTYAHKYLQDKIQALAMEDDEKLAAYVAEVLSERLAKTAAIKALKSLGSSMS